MRRIRHLTPRYIVNRCALMLEQRAHPDHPWLTKTAIAALDGYLKPTDMALEFGSGRSTAWFAKRVRHLTSVEHDESWFHKVRAQLEADGLRNVTYLLRTVSEEAGEKAPYVAILDDYPPGTFDFVLIDGHFREYCASAALARIKPGGLLVIDNVNWYLPSGTVSPASRSVADGPSGPHWSRIAQELQSWRSIWTSNGVTDTAFYFKPRA
jgi:predicted O-methyltransferase YrrM